MHKILVHAQDSCACTRLLCMHWAREPKGQGPSQGPGTRPATQKSSGPGPGTGPAAFLGPRPGPWPLQCMHKSVVHAQECCACTRILCMHENLVHAQYLFYSYINDKYCSETFPYQRSDFLVHLHSRLRRIQWRIVKFGRTNVYI